MQADEKITLRYSPTESARLIKEEARRLGFSACGFAEAEALPPAVVGTYERFLSEGRHGEMDYLERNRELRYAPAALLPGTRTVISVALNYFPKTKQSPSAPQIAYYAYGKDYHRVVKRLLDQLLDYIRREICPEVTGRSFSDSAPIAERYWACRAGIGWVGRSGMLVLPEGGTFFFLGELLVDIPLPSDSPMVSRCGSCRRCIESCPTGAISEAGFDSRLCVSYLTIEHAGEIPQSLAEKLGNRFYGCDSCQLCCPWNRYAHPSEVEAFTPREALLSFNREDLATLDEDSYRHFFGGSAMKRAGLDGLLRNARALRHAATEDEETPS